MFSYKSAEKYLQYFKELDKLCAHKRAAAHLIKTLVLWQ